MKKTKHIAHVQIENLEWCDFGGYFSVVGDVFTTINGVRTHCDDYINIETFLKDSHFFFHHFNFSTINFKQLNDFNHKTSPHYWENRHNYNQAQQNKRQYSCFYLNSCNCGVPYCTGINNGVQIYRDGEFMVYKTNKKSGLKKGILNTGFRKIYVPFDDIRVIRQKITHFKNNTPTPNIDDLVNT